MFVLLMEMYSRFSHQAFTLAQTYTVIHIRKNWGIILIEEHVLNRSIPIPLYYQIKSIICSEIEQGNYQPGDMIPTEEEMIRHFNVSSTTVRQAVTEMVQEGKLYRRKGKGTFVAQSKLKQDLSRKQQSLFEQMTQQGKTLTTKVLDLRIGAAPTDVAQTLEIDDNSSIVFFQCCFFSDSTPLMLQKNYLPSPAADYLLSHDFSTEPLRTALKNHDPSRAPHHAHNVIETIPSSQFIAANLGIQEGDPILLIHTTLYTSDNIPLCHERSYYRGDRNRFEISTIL